jgi:Arc/MetJ-type ribon-helix-helix transcriptional regulator
MAKIYLANCTLQHLKHCYRLRESGKLSMVEIDSGRQAVLGENWNDSQVEGFIQHLESCGFRRSNETSRKLPEFGGLLYSVGKPIAEEQIHHGNEALVEHQEYRSASEATKSALAFDTANRMPKDKRKRLAKITEITVEQDIPPRQKATGNEVKMHLTIAEDGHADNRTAKLPI